jgi:hypothetical protein
MALVIEKSESRISDSIPPLAGTPLYHLQDGELWAHEDGEWKRLDAYDDVTEYDEEELQKKTPATKKTTTGTMKRKRKTKQQPSPARNQRSSTRCT